MKPIFVSILFLFLFQGVLAECGDSQIDLNSASLADLEKITWVGPATAQKIIDARPFTSVDDLDKVKGIGEVKLRDIKTEGVACVYEEEEIDVKKEIIKEEEVVKNNKTKVYVEETSQDSEMLVLKQKVDEPIMLNSLAEEKELVYESKNAKMFRYLPYAFSLFLIFVIIFLLRDK